MINKIKPIHAQDCNCENCKNNIVMVPIDINSLSDSDREIIDNYMTKNGNIVSNTNIDMPRPAIRYDGFNVYTNNGIVNIPSNVYNVLSSLGTSITDLISHDINSDTFNFDMNTLELIVSTSMCICIDNFILTLDNLYSVAIENINNKFKTYFIDKILSEMTAEEDYYNMDYSIKNFKFSPCFHFINRTDLSKAISTYISIGPKARENMYDNIMSFSIAYINKSGLSIYNNLRNELTSFCEIKEVTKNGNNIVKDMFSFIENEFSNIMIAFTSEAAVFSNNIVENFDILFNPEKYIAKYLQIENS